MRWRWSFGVTLLACSSDVDDVPPSTVGLEDPFVGQAPSCVAEGCREPPEPEPTGSIEEIACDPVEAVATLDWTLPLEAMCGREGCVPTHSRVAYAPEHPLAVVGVFDVGAGHELRLGTVDAAGRLLRVVEVADGLPDAEPALDLAVAEDGRVYVVHGPAESGEGPVTVVEFDPSGRVVDENIVSEQPKWVTALAHPEGGTVLLLETQAAPSEGFSVAARHDQAGALLWSRPLAPAGHYSVASEGGMDTAGRVAAVAIWRSFAGEWVGRFVMRLENDGSVARVLEAPPGQLTFGPDGSVYGGMSQWVAIDRGTQWRFWVEKRSVDAAGSWSWTLPWDLDGDVEGIVVDGAGTVHVAIRPVPDGSTVLLFSIEPNAPSCSYQAIQLGPSDTWCGYAKLLAAGDRLVVRTTRELRAIELPSPAP